MASETISIILPVLNEAKNLEQTIARVQTGSDVEIIVVDGGSTDGTAEIARSLSTRVILSPNVGRGGQMNAGAAIATGDILLFLHGDTLLPLGYEEMARAALAQAIAGAFELAIDSNRPSLRWIEKTVNWRSRFLQFPYGDQGIFLKASVFREFGGFPKLPIMEDFELIRQLRRNGKIAIVPTPVLTSGRRWQKLGAIKTTAINQLIILGYFLGIPPTTLWRWYRGQRRG